MMFKKCIFITIFFLSLTTCAQTKVILFSKTEKIVPKINIPLAADKLVTAAATDFNSKFKAATGETLKIERSNGLNKNYTYILLRINPTQKENFCIYRKSGNITIQGSSTQNLFYGISDFFKHYTNLHYPNGNEQLPQFDSEIIVPERFSRCESPNFRLNMLMKAVTLLTTQLLRGWLNAWAF